MATLEERPQLREGWEAGRLRYLSPPDKYASALNA